MDTLKLKKMVIVKIFYNLNPFYRLFNHASVYIEEKIGNKYLIFDDSVNKNKRSLKKYTYVWNRIKNEIKAINGGKE